MYGILLYVCIFTYIYHEFMVNVGKYAMHGSYGILWSGKTGKNIKLQLVTKASFDYVSQRLQLEISFYPQMGPTLLLMIYPELFP